MATTHHVGQRLSYDGALCTVRYVGEVAGTSATWLGVEWDDAGRGKHDGSHKGTRYFSCLSKSPTAASFIRPSRPAEKAQSFISALYEKYAADIGNEAAQVVISGKVAQEMGFDKIRRRQANVEELQNAIVDGLRVTHVRDEGQKPITETCPAITTLELSRNLFEGFGPVVDICSQLKGLRRLGLSGNRFLDVRNDAALRDCEDAFRSVEELGLQENLISWEELCHIATRFSSLSSLNLGTNQLSCFPEVPFYSLASTLTTLNLEFNEITALSQLSGITGLSALRNLHLKGNNVASLTTADTTTAPVFPVSLQYLDLSYNEVGEWSFVDALPTHFPGMTGLRLAHNPVYNNAAGATSGDDSYAASSEEAHMTAIARLAPLKSLNFSTVSATDRANAEMFYLSRIAKQLAAVPESAEHTVKAQHPRYEELCGIYGEPDVIRRDEINPAFLEARLVNVTFHGPGDLGKEMRRIPKSFDVYAVKGVAGRLFGLSPLGLRLIWETGEWDPVAGFYDSNNSGGGDEDEDSSDDDDVRDQAGENDEQAARAVEDKTGRWVKREVELKDGPRQLGYCVDGLDVTIRVEASSSV